MRTMRYDEYPTRYADIEYVPENSDDGHVYVWRDFVEEALGNLTYAEILCDLADWQHPSTIVDEDVQEGFIEYDTEIGTIRIIEDDREEYRDAVYDSDFFNIEEARMLAGSY